MTDPLSASAIGQALEAGCRSLRLAPEVPRLGHRLEIHDRIASTNDRIDELGSAGAPEGCAVFAEIQTAGRGRGGNRWSAPPGRNLTFSVLLRPACPLPQWPRIAHVTGLAVARALEPWAERAPVLLKWPNDVYADGRKLAGILLELKGGRAAPHLVLGIGVNVNSEAGEFPRDLAQTLTSIRTLNGGTAVDRNHLAGAILAELTALYERSLADFPGILDEARDRSLLMHRAIRFSQQGVWREGELIGFGENGEMRVRMEGTGSLETISAAENVRLRDDAPRE